MRRNAGQVKNRAPAPIQISAEQILREAAERQEQQVLLEPVIKIHDAEEYQSHLYSRRKHFEDNIRYRRESMGNWVKYAKFEEENKEFERSRSIYERALEVDHRSSELWLRYSEFEMRNEFINHARNILDRAVSILPRVDFLWYKYVYMEEMIMDIPKTRAVFERFMKWMPDDNAWLSYARFESRCKNMDGAKNVMERYVNAYPSAKAFLRYAKWAEFESRDVALARKIFEATLTELDLDDLGARVFKQFSSFEERQGEYERARVIYKHAVKLLRLGQELSEEEKEDLSEYEISKREELYKAYISFEKKYGNRQGIEDVILTKQRAQYALRVKNDPLDYDAWFEYAKLEEQHGDAATVRDIYERAVANLPPEEEKKFWKRYIYLWIYYAIFEELVMHDISRALQVYEACLSLIPHSKFTFSKIWIYNAKLFLRHKDVTSMRKLLGKAIGMLQKEKLYKEYISLELALGEIDRCRSLYQNYVKAMPQKSKAWGDYCTLEQSVGETDRCRALYELAISQPQLDMPEQLWKNYIDFEIQESEAEKVRVLYQRLLERTAQHVKVWISYAQFEGNTPPPLGKGIEQARTIFQQAYDQLKTQNLKEERVLLLDAWRSMEKSHGDTSSISKVDALLPRRVKRKRMCTDANGKEIGWEEYFDYHFPDDQQGGAIAGNLKLLEMAAQWKKKKSMEQDDSSSSSSSSDDEEEG